MARATAGENDAVLSTLPAGPGERRLALRVVLLSLALFLAAAPFAKLPLAQVPAFLPFYESALFINDAITALLLFGQAHAARSLGAGPQSTSWLYILWHAAFPLVVIAYAAGSARAASFSRVTVFTIRLARVS